MAYLVDAGVWSLALRRDKRSSHPEVDLLRAALTGGDEVMTTGTILLELLRGAVPPKGRLAIAAAFNSLTFVEPYRADYEAAADHINTCQRHGVQLGTVDALLAQLAIRHDLALLTTDQDFDHAAAHIPLQLWRSDRRS